MNKEFIPYKLALELKELGFNEPCFAVYEDKKWQLVEFKNSMSYELCLKTDTFPVPTFSQAFRWFREKYNLTSWVYNSDVDKFFYTILQNGRIIKAHDSVAIYEKAELACLEKLIEIVKNK